MKINNETKVGLLTIVAVALLILGFNFLKGKDIFDNKKKLYAIFDKVGSLTKANAVEINGLAIGSVYDIEETDKNLTGIKVTISLTRDVNIPVNSVAYIKAPFGGLGSASITVEKGNASTFLKDGDKLNTRVDEGLFGGLSAEISPTLNKVRNSLDSLNRVFGNINKLFDTDAKRNLQLTIANLQGVTYALNRMVGDNGPLARTMNNVGSITDNLRNNNDSISAILSNTRRFTKQLSELTIQQTMDTLEVAINQFKYTVQKLSSNDGTLGALINDRALYNKLNDAVLSAEILMDDLRTHPKRYVNLSIFGKKDKGGALTSPAIKDSVPR